MLEVEVKYRVPDHAAATARLADLRAAQADDRLEADHYFNAPDRDFKQTDEAFRLRRVGAKNRFTYKGPRRETATKTRTEIEIPLGDGDAVAADAERMLVSLGYRPVAVVRKRRELYALDRGGWHLEVCLDTVEGVGTFVEIEVQADESRFEDAKAAVLGAATDFGLTTQEPRSYLAMWLART